MRKITAIKVQKRNSNRVNIYLDGEYAFGLARIVAAWLSVGQTLEETKIAELLAEDTRERAYQQALLFLSYRARSEKEIRQNLRKHEIPETVIEETLKRLRRGGFANDEEFARAWVENRSTFRPRGRRALTVELRQKGLNDAIIETVLEQVDDEALAYAAGKKKARTLQAYEWPDFRKKLTAFLARRGFSYATIAPLVQQLWDEAQQAGEHHT
ncbi:MAG: RecX family transcriptional regulator [Anaerolineales bacterium]